jgi:hypothetical protein
VGYVVIDLEGRGQRIGSPARLRYPWLDSLHPMLVTASDLRRGDVGGAGPTLDCANIHQP